MKEIVILGAGYAGLRALKELQKSAADIHITLVDRNDYHYEATNLHEVAAGTQPKEKISYPIKDVVDPQKTTFIQNTVKTIDADNRTVILADGATLNYDYLIVALGFQSETFGIPGAEEFALEMVDIDSAAQIHAHILAQMKKYQETKDETYLRIVVCGAGFTGIELVGSLVEASKKYAASAGVEAKDIQIYCVEAADKILPMFSEKLGRYCLKHFNNWGVHMMTGKPIKQLAQDEVIYQNSTEEGDTASLQAKTIIWTTGVSGSRVIGDSGFEQRRGRVMVSANLTDTTHPDVYLLGDVSAVMDPSSNRPYPTTAQIALKMGAYAGNNILQRVKGETNSLPFTFKSQGSVASIGNTHAFGVVGKMEVSAYPASVLKKIITDRALFETGGMKEVFAKGRFDFYH